MAKRIRNLQREGIAHIIVVGKITAVSLTTALLNFKFIYLDSLSVPLLNCVD